MKPTKIGQVAKFQTPLSGEDPNQLYVILEINKGENFERADIKALNTGLPYPPINTVKLDDLIVVELLTEELIGQRVTITKSNNSQVEGKVISLKESKINLDLVKGIKGIATNVYLTILDENGKEHTGTLFVS